MWPLEFTATPVASPRWKSGGSFRKSGTEWKRISGGCWAKRGEATKRHKTRSECFIEFNLVIWSVCTRIIRRLGNQSPARYLYWASVRATTERRPWRTSGESAKSLLDFIWARETGLASGFPALSLTAGFSGVEASTEWRAAKLLLLRGCKARYRAPILRMADELGEPLELCFFPFGSDDPIRAHPLVPRGSGTEKFPSGLVGAKLLFLLATEAGALSLLVGVDAGFLFAACGKSLEAGGIHQTLLCEVSNEVDIDGAPGAAGLAGGEANCVAGSVEALANAVDPAEAECYFYGFGPGDARFSGTLFMEANEKFAEFVVMGFEPRTEVRWRRKEGWF